MGKFTAMLKKGGGIKSNNHPQAAAQKIAHRRLLLQNIPGARVFDAFAGSGKMHREVWHQASHYVGCDLKWYRDNRSAFVAKNQRVLRCIDLQDFNIFDLDAYGAPWEQATIVAARRKLAPGERIGLALTDGSGLNLKMGTCSKALAALCRLPNNKIPGLNNVHAVLTERAVNELAARMNGKVVEKWEYVRPSVNMMRYTAIVIEAMS